MTPDELIQHATAAFQAARYDEAASLIEQAVAISPQLAHLHAKLGRALEDVGRPELAVIEYERTIRLLPNSAGAHQDLGVALATLGRWAESEGAYRRALQLDPLDAGTMNNLGGMLLHAGRIGEAIECFARAIALRPDLAEAYNNLGNARMARDELDGAIACFGEALKLRPEFADAHNGMGMALIATGEVRQAAGHYRRAMGAGVGAHSLKVEDNRLFSMQFNPDCDAGQIVAEHRAWNQRWAAGVARMPPLEGRDRSEGRRLRVGYVSADFSEHVIGGNILPLLREHDREQFQVYCYSNTDKPDGMTERLRACADQWRNIVGVNDQSVAETIRADGIDILVDLSLHSGGNRLMVFARKPAAVQVTFAGYPGTTGLAAMDYRLTDPYLDPPGLHDEDYSERSVRLADSFWCYDPEAWALKNVEAVGPLPAEKNGYVTFGSLNGFWKINEALVELWGRVLQGTAGSKLRVLAPRAEEVRRRFVQRLGQCGVGAERVEFVSRQRREGYFAEYNKIDVGLDTLPYNGHTTSLDSLWMGAPVVTRVGRTVVGRAGWSQLSNLGLRELAGRDNEQFVKIAVELAGNLPRLAELRRTLRGRMEGSPLTDAKRFARNVEAAYRGMWIAWRQSV